MVVICSISHTNLLLYSKKDCYEYCLCNTYNTNKFKCCLCDIPLVIDFIFVIMFKLLVKWWSTVTSISLFPWLKDVLNWKEDSKKEED